ncbi:MAG: DEAD/DEAH box helicase family protein [Bacilli bacterium]
MFHKIFELEKYNIISDENNFYFFRALNNGDTNDIKNNITTNEYGQIERIRTDRERYEQEPKYKEDSKISLKEIFDHIKMHHSKDTNCISLTTNANVAALYGRENYEDKYVMIKIPKEEIGKEVVNAGVYMMEEITERINYYKQNIDSYTKDKDLSAKIIYSLTAIENSKNQTELERNIENIKNNILKEYIKEDSKSIEYDIFERGIDYTYENTNTVDYPALNEYQNFEKNKIIAMIDILQEDIIPGVNNKFLIQTLGNAFSSLEFIHYNDIKRNKIIETPKEIVDVFSLLQQVSDNPKVRELKQKVLEYNFQNPENIKSFKYSENEIKAESDYTIENMYNLTKGNVSFKEATEVYKKSFYLSKSKLRTLSAVDLLIKITENDSNYNEIIEKLKEETYGIEPEIFSRNNKKKFQVSESISLDFNTKETGLFKYIDQLNTEDLEQIIKNPMNALRYYLENFSEIKEKYIDKETYYANAIIDSFDWSTLNIVEFSPRRRNIIVEKLLEYDIVEIYNSLKEQGIKETDIANALLTTIIKEKDLNDENINTKETFTKEELEYFLGFYQVKGTKKLRLRSYQATAVNNIDKGFETHDFQAAVLPTGAGKSFIALSEMLQHQEEEILYLEPNDEILNQIQRYILKYIYTKELNYKTKNDLEDKELIEDLTKDEKDLIKEVFPNLKLSTYQKLIGINQKEIIDKKYDFIIMDELHRTGAKEWVKRVEELLENQLKDQTKKTKVLGITATPQRDYDNEDMANKWANFYGYTK